MKEYQTFLIGQLADHKQKNSQFSLRAFAKKLDMSPAHLSSLINGRKNLTPKQAAKIIDKLNLDDASTTTLLQDLLPQSTPRKTEIVEARLLSDDEFKMISDWKHFAILSLSQLKSNRANGKWIGQKLALDPYACLEALQRLERMGFVTIENGQFQQTSKPLTTTSSIPSQAIRNYHQENLRLGAEKLDTVKVEDRDFSSITMAVNPQKLAKAKRMIRDFRNKLCQELEVDETTEVYTLAIQLFPLTK